MSVADLDRARAGFAEALDGHPWITPDELIGEVLEGKAQLWAEGRSDVFTRLHDNGILEMGPVAGNLVEMLNVTLPKIETWAHAAGAKEIHVQAGREGWERPLKQRGYEVVAVIMRKVL